MLTCYSQVQLAKKKKNVIPMLTIGYWRSIITEKVWGE